MAEAGAGEKTYSSESTEQNSVIDFGHNFQQNQTPKQSQLKCPQCGSTSLYKDGLRYLSDGSSAQRWLCRNCGYRFTDPNHKAKSGWKIPPSSLNSRSSLLYSCQGNNDPDWREPTARKAALTLATVENNTKSGQAGAVATNQMDAHGKIIELLWWMKRQNYAESTIVTRVRVLKVLVKRGADLFDPESIKHVIAQQKWSEGRKANAIKAYTTFLKMVGGKWQPPICKDVRKIPFIPLEREIDDLIVGCNQYIATFLRVAKETGARAGEIYNLKWIDVDFERQTIRITAEKNSNPRIFKMSNMLIAMLQKLPKERDYIFHHYRTLNHLRRSFQRYRKRIAFKLGNPRILQITIHTLRHWKATMEYAKTKDILHTMQVLGHKNIKNTLVYTQLAQNLGEEEYVCRVAKTPSAVQELIEAGFEYVCQKDDLTFFRKRK
ncbi:MAG: tyrosine-type recombinase/integrase [Candidatus Bathyarchaeia archaeon]